MFKINDEFIENFMIPNSEVIKLSKNDPIVDYLSLVQEMIMDEHYDKKPYLNTNQNQQYIRDLLKEEYKKCFVILSGGDLVFQLLLNGKTDITAVDINEFQRFIYALKCASIRTLNASEYENFLTYRNGINFLSKDIFKYVKDGFLKSEEDEKRFWDILLNGVLKEDIKDYFFKGGLERMPIDISRDSLQFTKRNKLYFKVREGLEKANIQIKYEEASEVLANENQTYDFIDLSNILLFQYDFLSFEEYSSYIKKMKEIYQTKLNDNGLMIFDYMFGTTEKNLISKNNYNLVETIYNKTLTELKKEFDLSYQQVSAIPGVLPIFGTNDEVVYSYKKNN